MKFEILLEKKINRPKIGKLGFEKLIIRKPINLFKKNLWDICDNSSKNIVSKIHIN